MRKVLNLVVVVVLLLIGGAIGWNVFQEQRSRLQSEAEEAQRKPPKRQTALRPVVPATVAEPAASPTVSMAAPAKEQPQAAAAQPQQPVVRSFNARGTPSPARGLLDRHYSWAEVETILEKLREERKEHPDAIDDLQSWYSALAMPAYSESKDIPEHCAKLAEWRREFPQSPTPLVILGQVHKDWAWDARGSGWASTVTNEGWELFHTRIDEARRLLGEAIKLGVKDGHAHSVLVTVAMASSLPRDQTQAIVDEGLELDPAYHPICQNMAQYLMPRWLGEPGDIEEFAADIVKKIPGDDGLAAYGHIAYLINQYDCLDSNTLFWGGYDRKLLSQAAEVLVKRYPDAPNLVPFAALCTVAAQDQAAARRIKPFIPADGDTPRVRTWPAMRREFFHWCDATEIPTGESNWVWGTQFHYGNIAFGPDSRFIWCGNGGYPTAVTLLDLETRQLALALPGVGAHLGELEFDNDKGWVLGTMTGDKFQGWVLWNLNEAAEPMKYPTPDRVEAIAINPETEQIAWADAKTVRTIDMATGLEGFKIDLKHVTHNLKFSANGSMLAVEGNGVSVYDAQSGELKYELPGPHSKPLPKVVFENVLDFDEQGRIWASGYVTGSVPSERPLLRSTADGQSWDVLIPNLWAEVQTQTHSAKLSPDKTRLAIAEQRQPGKSEIERIQIWDLETQKISNRLPGHWNHIGDLAFSPDGKQLASIARMGGVIKIWSLDSQSAGEESSSAQVPGPQP